MKKLILVFVISVFTFFLSACTSVRVSHIDESHEIDKICIEENNAVIFNEFIDSITSRIEYHGIKTILFAKEYKPLGCDYTLWYTALRSWDFSPYLSHAELKLYKHNQLIGEATYHLNGGGGLSLSKWASVSTKMNPVVDELLNKKIR